MRGRIELALEVLRDSPTGKVNFITPGVDPVLRGEVKFDGKREIECSACGENWALTEVQMAGGCYDALQEAHVLKHIALLQEKTVVNQFLEFKGERPDGRPQGYVDEKITKRLLPEEAMQDAPVSNEP